MLGSWIAVTNILLQVIFRYVSKFRRETDQAEVDKSTTFNIFIAMFFNTAGLVTLAHSNFFAGKERLAKNSKFDIFVGTYSEYNSEWYLNIGSVIQASQVAMMVFPHVFVLLQAIYLIFKRCIDRRGSFNTKNTSTIIQDDYENMYTGPYFILQVRYAQVLFTIFVTFTFSAGMPILYLSNFVILFIQYWVDKWLVFNFYRLTPQFTKELSMFATSMLPLTLVTHFGGGLLMYGYP